MRTRPAPGHAPHLSGRRRLRSPARPANALLVTLVAAILPAATPRAASPASPSGLDRLVEEGLARNRVVEQERLVLEQSRAAYREAVGGYLPAVSAQARYSGRAGEITDFGQLINPAFAALNQLTGQSAFPTDLELRLPSRQETSLRLVQPIFEPRVLAACRIQGGRRDAQAATVLAAERRLAADLRLGYLRYEKALRLVELYDSTLVLVNEAVRVQESLSENGAATPDQVLRARADRSETDQARLEAIRLATAARQSLNQLLGRPVDRELDRLSDEELGLELSISLDSALTRAGAVRAELSAARGGIDAARGRVALSRAEYVPSLVGVVDWGIQGEDYHFDQEHDYLVASLVLEWNLFDGGRREARRQQATAELARARLVEADAAELIALDVRVSWEAARVAQTAVEAARDRLSAARRSYELVARRYTHGAASFLELLDARTTFTQAGLNEIVTACEYRERCAELDRAAALYPNPPASGGDTP